MTSGETGLIFTVGLKWVHGPQMFTALAAFATSTHNVFDTSWTRHCCRTKAELICIADFNPSGLGGYAAALHDRPSNMLCRECCKGLVLDGSAGLVAGVAGQGPHGMLLLKIPLAAERNIEKPMSQPSRLGRLFRSASGRRVMMTAAWISGQSCRMVWGEVVAIKRPHNHPHISMSMIIYQNLSFYSTRNVQNSDSAEAHDYHDSRTDPGVTIELPM